MGLVAFTCLISSYAFSAVTLTVPEEIKLISVNQQELRHSVFRSKDEYKLNEGQYTFGVRYQQFFQHADNSHDILKSSVVMVQSPVLRDGQHYSLALINAPRDFDAAQKYKQQPSIGLYDVNKQLLSEQMTNKEVSQPLLGKALFNNGVDLTSKETLKSQPVVETPVNVTQAQTMAPSSVDTKKQQINTANISADQQLIEWWQSASKTERQKFMSWLATQ